MKNIIKIKTSDLTDEQKMIYNTDIELWKNISIKWWPWTGKTTLLFLIAQKIKNLRHDFRIITLQNNLKNFLKDSFWDLDEHVKNAWWTTSPDRYPEMRGVMYDLANNYEVDFSNLFSKSNYEKDNILKILLEKVKNDEKLKNIYKNTVILIDESQDLPILYFDILKELFNTIYVFWDDNQKINDWWSEISEIEKKLDITIIDTYFNINFRNAKQIYNFAELTWFKEDEIELPINWMKIKIFIWDYDKKYEIEEIISDNIWKNIAVITSYNEQNNYSWINWIQIVNLNQNYIKYDSYDNFCLHFKNNKGLEFDIVILVDFNKKQFFSKEMYVSITRAKNNIYVLDNEIMNYLDIENNDNFNIIDKNNKKKDISVEDLPF